MSQQPGGLASREVNEDGTLTIDQINIITALERTSASISMVGVVLVFAAYGTFKRLRTVPSTFVVFASLANIGAGVASMMGFSGVLAGVSSPPCQAQAFMLEMFIQSDPWWSFAMAVNVYMVFFFSADPQSFVEYWWVYFLICYGVPFVPAIWLLLVRGVAGDAVYGDATIWCWIDQSWSNLRIYTYYLPIWACIGLSACIYVAIGYYVFRQRNRLRDLTLNGDDSVPMSSTRGSGTKKDPQPIVMGSVNTEVVQIVTRHGEPSHPAICRPEPAAVRDIFDGLSGGPQGPGRLVTDLTPPHVWPTVTRISADPAPTLRFRCRVRNAFERWITKFSRMDPVKLAYLRTSFVFTVSVIVTWTPSSLNRVHDLLSRGHASFGLNLASAVVLPLQGLWNAIIFFTASWSPLREALLEEWDAMRGRPRGYRVAQSCQQEMQRQRTASLGRHRRNLSDYPGRIPDASGSDIGDLLRTATSSPVHLSASRNSTDTVHIFRDGRAALA